MKMHSALCRISEKVRISMERVVDAPVPASAALESGDEVMGQVTNCLQASWRRRWE